jgi:gluconate 5-dehydrogenase
MGDISMTHDLFELRDKVVLITGSSHGLGFAIARGLGQSRAALVLNGRNVEKLESIVSTLSGEVLTVSGYAFDVTKEEQIQGKISIIEDEIGRIQILVNSAGIQKRGFLETIDESAWREVLAIVVESRLSSDDILHCLTDLFIKHVAQSIFALITRPEFTAKAEREWL